MDAAKTTSAFYQNPPDSRTVLLELTILRDDKDNPHTKNHGYFGKLYPSKPRAKAAATSPVG
jgi:hypothetical protein